MEVLCSFEDDVLLVECDLELLVDSFGSRRLTGFPGSVRSQSLVETFEALFDSMRAPIFIKDVGDC